jgi:hypothetical protein
LSESQAETQTQTQTQNYVATNKLLIVFATESQAGAYTSKNFIWLQCNRVCCMAMAAVSVSWTDNFDMTVIRHTWSYLCVLSYSQTVLWSLNVTVTARRTMVTVKYMEMLPWLWLSQGPWSGHRQVCGTVTVTVTLSPKSGVHATVTMVTVKRAQQWPWSQSSSRNRNHGHSQVHATVTMVHATVTMVTVKFTQQWPWSGRSTTCS